MQFYRQANREVYHYQKYILPIISEIILNKQQLCIYFIQDMDLKMEIGQLMFINPINLCILLSLN